MSSKRPAHSPITAGAEKRPRVGEKNKVCFENSDLILIPDNA
jgi:hypothetical protein